MRFLKGVVQTEAGRTADAIETFSGLNQDYPELPEPYNNLAVLYAGQSQFDKARTALEQAVRANPDYAIAHENLGDVYAKLAGLSYSKAQQLDTANATVPPKLALIRQLFAPADRTRPVRRRRARRRRDLRLGACHTSGGASELSISAARPASLPCGDFRDAAGVQTLQTLAHTANTTPRFEGVIH